MKYAGPGFYGLQPPPWVSGVQIAKGQWLTSPADNEIYQRIADTGTGPNLFTFADELDNAAWQKARATVTANAATALDGTTTADKIVEDSSASNTHYIWRTASGTVNTNSHTVSIEWKAGERTRVNLFLCEGATFARSVDCTFNLSAGTAGAVTAAGGASGSATIESKGSGWYVCRLTAILGGSDTSIQARAQLVNGAGSISYTGDGVSGVYARRLQLASDAIDPADDVTNYVARSYERTDAILGAAMLAAAATGISSFCIGATKSIYGALGVGARTSVLSVTGRGCLDYLVLSKGASGTQRIEVIVDGRTVLDRTDTHSSSTYLMALGMASANGGSNSFVEARFDPAGVQFRRALQIYVTNVTTDSAAAAGIAYHLRSVA